MVAFPLPITTHSLPLSLPLSVTIDPMTSTIPNLPVTPLPLFRPCRPPASPVVLFRLAGHAAAVYPLLNYSARAMSTKLRELMLLGRAHRALAEAKSIDEVKDLRDKAIVVKAYAKKAQLSHEILLDAAAIKLGVERKLGQMLAKLKIADSSLGNQHTGNLDRSQKETSPIQLKDLGLTKSDSSRAQQIARLPASVFNRFLADNLKAKREPTTNALLRLVKQSTNGNGKSLSTPAGDTVTSLQDLIDAGRTFPTIYPDPPWPYKNESSRAAAKNHYPTMSLDAICPEPVAAVAAGNSHLHLLTTNSFLQEAFAVIEAWGFVYKSCFVWVKPQIGMGNYWRVSQEFLLFATSGRLAFRDNSQRSWIECDRTVHSRKPAVVRDLVEKVSPGPYLEMYGREELSNPAWTVYGNHFTTP